MVCSQIRSGFKGYRLWRRLINKNKFDFSEDWMILIPAGDSTNNFCVLKLMNRFYDEIIKIKDKQYKKGLVKIQREKIFVLVTDDEEIAKFGKQICPSIKSIEVVSKQQMWGMITGYAMYPYNDRLIIGLLEGLEGRGNLDALEAYGVSREEVIINGLFRMRKKKGYFEKLEKARGNA